MVVFWFVSFILLLILECVTVNMVSIWFAIGALFTFFITFVTDSAIIQTIVFIVVSIITLLITKPLVKKLKAREGESTNLDRILNKKAIVTKSISKHNPGEVKVQGNIWTAISEDALEEKDEALVVSIDGVKLIVKKVEEEK